LAIQYTSCPLDCFDGCRFAVEVEGNRVVKIMADPEHKVTAGFICAKGRNHRHRLYSEARITSPLIRDDNTLRPLSLDNALNLWAEKLTQTVKVYGSTAIMNYAGSGSGGLLHGLGERFFNALGGVTEAEGSLCWGSGLAAQKLDFGALKAHSWEDLVNSELIVLWGRDPHTTNTHLWPYIQKAQQQGSRLLVINPLLIRASQHADLVIQPQPGSDGALALAMAQVIIAEGLTDPQFINQHTSGYEEYAALTQTFTLSEAADLTGVAENDIKAAAYLYANSKPAAILFGYGMQRYANSGHTVRYIDALAALTANLGVAGGGANYAHQVWKEELNDISAKQLATSKRFLPMPTLASAMMAANDPPLQVVNISRANPVTQHPDSYLMARALKQTPLVVVADMFITDTVQLADLVFPCTSFFEETNLLKSSWHYYLHYYPALVKPPGECLPDYELYQRLAAIMGLSCFEYQHPDDWIRWVIRPLTNQYGLTLEGLKERPWLHPQANVTPWYDQNFATADGKYHFCTQELTSPQHRPDSEYPWRLLTSHRRDRLHSQGFEQDNQPVMVQINPNDAARAGINEAAMVLVQTPNGELSGQASISNRTLPGVVVITQGSWLSQGGGVNQLTGEVTADMGNGTPLYDCCCRVQPI